MNSSGMGLLTRQDETTQDLLAVGRVEAAGEAAEVAAEMAEEALGQIGGAQAMTPAGRPAQVGQDAVELGLDYLYHGEETDRRLQDTDSGSGPVVKKPTATWTR